MNVLLSALKRFYCPCLDRVAWFGYKSTLDDNILEVEKKLVENQNSIANLSTDALRAIRTALTSSASNRFLQNLQTRMTQILTISDYPKINWTNIQNCNDMWNRVKFIEFKRLQYMTIYQSSYLNYSSILTNRLSINVTSSSSSADRNLRDALNATMNLEKSFVSYHSLLVYSIGKMSKMIADFNYYGDTHCSCEGGFPLNLTYRDFLKKKVQD